MRTYKILILFERKIQGTENLCNQRNAEINLSIDANFCMARDTEYYVSGYVFSRWKTVKSLPGDLFLYD